MPRPSPLWRRLIELSAWRKRSNTYGRKSAGMPMPVSLTKISASPSPRRQPHRDLAALRGELQGVRQQVPHHLLQSIAVARPRRRRAASSRSTLIDFAVTAGISDSMAASIVDLRSTVEVSRCSLPPTMRDTSRMSSINCACAAAFCRIDLGRPLHGRAVAGALPEHVRPAHDRVQRRAQLVRQGREELVLQPVGRFGLEPGRLFAQQQADPLLLDARALFDFRRQLEVGGGQLAGALGDASFELFLRPCAAPPAG